MADSIQKHAIIVGSGVAGLASAIRLRQKGYQVTVFEANAYPGGKLSQFRLGEYRFDAGPSLFTMPHYVEELFEITGRKTADYFSYQREEEACRYFWEDGTSLIAWADQEKFATEVSNKLGVPAKKIIKKLQHSKKMYELAGQIFLEKPLNRAKTWLNLKVVKSLLQLPVLGVFTTMHKANAELGHPKLTQLFDRYATYNGSDPYRAPATLNIIPHFEHGIGTFHPLKGMHSITESLYQLAVEMGIMFHFNEAVEKILHNHNTATGVKTAKGVYDADVVVSNMDITPTYRRLLSDIKAPERRLRQEGSSSALIFYWGIKRTFNELGLHNVIFGNDYQQEFDEIFKGIAPATDPTIYIHITSKEVAGDAPDGCENWFVMLNAPRDNNHNWDELIPQYKEVVLKKLTKILGVDPADYIEAESVLTPKLIEIRTSSAGGSLYGISSNNRYAAFLRHTNDSSRLKGLYFCGGSVHPGGGIPLCLLSAKIVSEICPNP